MPSREEDMQKPNLNLLIHAAEDGVWEYVDRHLPELADDLAVLEWAINTGLESVNENFRDLAASILEKNKEPLTTAVAFKLKLLMETDPGKHVRFRAACALCEHGETSPAVAKTLKQFVNDSDPEVASIAKSYLK
jgi:HEAT repeat protein